MSNEIAISYDIGVIHPGEQQELNIFILVNENNEIEEKIQKCVKLNTNTEFENVKNTETSKTTAPTSKNS